MFILVKKVILDVDTGVDDAQAIILALRSPELKVEAITAVSGNAHVDHTSMNSLKVLELAGAKNIPVAKGMSKPLIREYPSPKPTSHGPTGLAGAVIQPAVPRRE